MAWRGWHKGIAATAGAVALCVGLIGFAHTEAGRPLLRLFAVTAGCPISLDGADPAKVEQYRRDRLAERDGSERPKAQPAVAFDLGVTSQADVARFVQALGDRCETQRSGSVIRCRDLYVDDGPAIDDLHLQLDGQGRLVAVDAFRNGGDASASLAHFRGLGTRLDREVGAASSVHDASEQDLRRRSFRRASREYRYRGYLARVSVTNFGSRGLRVREQYQWLPEDKTASR